MVERGERGRLKPGSVLNPNGRPKRTDEEKFNAVLSSVVTPERFATALDKQMKKAEMGNLQSFMYICKLVGLEPPTKVAPTTPDGENPYMGAEAGELIAIAQKIANGTPTQE